MKTILTFLFALIATFAFAQKQDTLKISLTPFQKEEMIDGPEKKKKEIVEALEKQKNELFAQLDKVATKVLETLLDTKGIKLEDVESFRYKDGVIFITKKKK